MSKPRKPKLTAVQQEPMTDEEMQEMVYLYRVISSGNQRPGEEERCRELLRRFERLDYVPPASVPQIEAQVKAVNRELRTPLNRSDDKTNSRHRA